MVRVAGLLDQVAAGLGVRSPDGRTAQQTLVEVRERVLELTARQSKLWRHELRPALAGEGILIGKVDDAGEAELEELEATFAHSIYPVLTPLAVGPGQPFPYISGLSLSLGVIVRDPESGEERFARVKVPEGLPRFVSVGLRGLLIPLENVIATTSAGSFPRWRSSSRPRSASPATATPRSPTTRTTCWSRSRASSRSAGSARSCGSRSHGRSRMRC